jgi:hypothetical protein
MRRFSQMMTKYQVMTPKRRFAPDLVIRVVNALSYSDEGGNCIVKHSLPFLRASACRNHTVSITVNDGARRQSKSRNAIRTGKPSRLIGQFIARQIAY